MTHSDDTSPTGPPANPWAAPVSPQPPAAPAPGYPPPGYPPPGYPPPGYPPPGYASIPAVAPAGPGSGLAVTALVLGIASAVLCWIPYLGVIVAIAALTVGIIAWASCRSGRSAGTGMAIAATIVAAVALLLSIVLTVVLSRLISDVVNCADPSLTQAQQDQCLNDIFGITPSSTP